MHSALECQQTPDPSQSPCFTTGKVVSEGTLIQLESIAEASRLSLCLIFFVACDILRDSCAFVLVLSPTEADIMAAVGALGPLGRSIHRPVKTCTECKQVKVYSSKIDLFHRKPDDKQLRCDSKTKFPAPCSRCQTRNLQCVVDSSFRRTPARKYVIYVLSKF